MLAAATIAADCRAPLLSTGYYVPRFAARRLTWNDEPQAVVESVVWAYSTWILNQFDHVVFATAAHRNLFVKERIDVPTSIISNGIDTTRYRPLDGSDGNWRCATSCRHVRAFSL